MPKTITRQPGAEGYYLILEPYVWYSVTGYVPSGDGPVERGGKFFIGEQATVGGVQFEWCPV